MYMYILLLCSTLRYLVPSNDFSIENIHTFLTSVSQEISLASWRNIASYIDGADKAQDGLKVQPPVLSSVSNYGHWYPWQQISRVTPSTNSRSYKY